MIWAKNYSDALLPRRAIVLGAGVVGVVQVVVEKDQAHRQACFDAVGRQRGRSRPLEIHKPRVRSWRLPSVWSSELLGHGRCRVTG